MKHEGRAKCPNCLFKLEMMKNQALESYGKIPMLDFIRLEKEKEAFKSNITYTDFLYQTVETTFNFEKFKIVYYAKCDKCDYSYTFEHEEKTKDLLLMQKLEK